VTMKVSLTRADLVAALGELITELRARGETGGIRIVGGAALALSYFDRDVTQDIDAINARGVSNETVASAVRAVAQRLDFNENWLNFEVAQADALPTLGREVEWKAIYTSPDITLHVASAEALLVMKLRANRPGRDVPDIRRLLSLCGITENEHVQGLYESFYPGDVMPDRAIQIVTSIFAEVPPINVTSPPPPEFPGI
jgi:hypothetical protein